MTEGVVGVGYFQLSSGFPPPNCSGTAPLLKHYISLNIFHPELVFKSSGAITIVLGIYRNHNFEKRCLFTPYNSTNEAFHYVSHALSTRTYYRSKETQGI
jgi:hypothetical protein